jgi:hypothetical protein
MRSDFGFMQFWRLGCSETGLTEGISVFGLDARGVLDSFIFADMARQPLSFLFLPFGLRVGKFVYLHILAFSRIL